MQFYQLMHPNYETDYDDAKANPIQMIQETQLPGIICPDCGIWSGSRRLYLHFNGVTKSQLHSTQPLPQSEWLKLARNVRIESNLPDEFLLEPGDILGQPRARLMHDEIPDFMHPFPGQLIVRSSVVAALQKAKLTGFSPVRVDVHWNQKIGPPSREVPELYELIVSGKAWRIDVDEKAIITCQICGRTIFPYPNFWVVDEKRWDGTDFFNVDTNPNIVFVTASVCEVLEQEHFSNYMCKSLS